MSVSRSAGICPRKLLQVMLITLSLGLQAVCANAQAATIAVLDFELNDLTMQPRIPAELERTASVKPLLIEQLQTRYGHTVVDISEQAQAAADKGVGYLFDRPERAAELARESGADWILVGRVHKPSFLFAYFKVNVVDVQAGTIKKELIVEVKGSQRKLTQKGVEAVVEQLQKLIGGGS